MPDLLGTERPRRRSPRWLLPVLLVLVAAGAAGDHLARTHEVDVLVRRAGSAEQTADYADRRVAATVQYAGSQLSSPSVPVAVRADLQRLVAAEAAGQLPPVRRAAVDVEQVRVLPWHGGVCSARATAAAYLRRRAAGLQAVAEGRQPPRVRDAGARAALARVSSRDRASAVYG